jgi:hypothetical protein
VHALTLCLVLLPAQTPPQSQPERVYRYVDSAGEEHFVNDPSMVPEADRASMQRLDLGPGSGVRVSVIPPTPTNDSLPGLLDSSSAEPRVAASSAARPRALWPPIIAGLLLLAFTVAHAMAPRDGMPLSRALSLGRLASTLVFVLTLIVAGYELRNDPQLGRYTPWGAFEGAKRLANDARQASQAHQKLLENIQGDHAR